MNAEVLQRLRIVFAKRTELKYISHLDLMRVWERALRRANVGLAYSHGFNPRPKLVFASALPVGFTGSAEMVDITLRQRIELREFVARLKRQLPLGLRLVSVTEVPNTLPPLPTQVIAAEYRVFIETPDTPQQIEARLNSLLAAHSIPRQDRRPGKVRAYDLRPLIQELRMIGQRGGMYIIAMRLQAGQQGTGRPDEVIDALGLSEALRAIDRVRLICKRT